MLVSADYDVACWFLGGRPVGEQRVGGGEIGEAAIPLHEIGGRRARGQFHMVRSSFEHRLGIEDVGIVGFLGESDTGTCQHEGRSNHADSKTFIHTLSCS